MRVTIFEGKSMGIMNIITNSTDKIDIVKSPIKDTVVGSNAEFVGNITFSKTFY